MSPCSQPLRSLHLDTTHPDAAAYLTEVYRTFRSWGIDFHKIDFIYAGALYGRRYADVDPVTAYREALQLIRDAMVKTLEGWRFDGVKGPVTVRADDHALLQPMFQARLAGGRPQLVKTLDADAVAPPVAAKK